MEIPFLPFLALVKIVASMTTMRVGDMSSPPSHEGKLKGEAIQSSPSHA
jgi:hypothetical protein